MIRRWIDAWNEFWFRPQPLANVGRFRIALGLVALMKLGLLGPVLGEYFSESGILTLEGSRRIVPPPRLCLFDLLPPDVAPVVLGVAIVVAVLFTLGLWTRLMAIALWALLVSLDQRNWLVLNSGDRLLSCLLFFGIFAPLGATYSLDRLIATRRGQGPPGPVEGPYWAVRLMQIQVCAMYFWSTVNKLAGEVWVSGEALYWVSRNVERARLPLPPILTETALGMNLLTYFTLLVEGLFPFAIWSSRWRGILLTAGVMLHVGIEYTMNIQVFQYVVLASYLLFLERN